MDILRISNRNVNEFYINVKNMLKATYYRHVKDMLHIIQFTEIFVFIFKEFIYLNIFKLFSIVHLSLSRCHL